MAGAISAAAAIALFSYLGIEPASVAAGRVRNPAKNVGHATVLGTLGCAVVYILGTLTVFGTVPDAALQTSTAPFTDPANAISGGQRAGNAVAIAAVVSGSVLTVVSPSRPTWGRSVQTPADSGCR